MVLDEEGSILTRVWCLYEAWKSCLKGREALVMMSYDVEFEKLEKVRSTSYVE